MVSPISSALLHMEIVAPILDVVNDHPYLSLTSVTLGCATLGRLARWRSRSYLPPGPKGYPIVGNLFDLPATHAWERFGAWGKQYGEFSFLHLRPPPHSSRFDVNLCSRDFLYTGDVTYINVLGQETIILNSHKAAVELLDKRSATYSDRPVLTMGGEIVGWSQSLLLTRYGPRFRESRKHLNRLIGAPPALLLRPSSSLKRLFRNLHNLFSPSVLSSLSFFSYPSHYPPIN